MTLSEGNTPVFFQRLDRYLADRSFVFETPYDLAKKACREFLACKGRTDLDPDEVLIVTLFIEMGASPKRASVEYSMTLTEAMLRNWQQNGNGHVYSHLGHLGSHHPGGYEVVLAKSGISHIKASAYEAIYKKSLFEHTPGDGQLEVPAADFKKFVWEYRLQSRYLASNRWFWRDHGGDISLLMKGAMIKSAYLQCSERTLAPEDKALVLRAFNLKPSQSWAAIIVGQIGAGISASGVGFREFHLGGYVAHSLILITDSSTSRIVLYIPGNSSPLHGFAHQGEMTEWIVQQCRDPAKRRKLEGYFLRKDLPDRGAFDLYNGVSLYLLGIARYPNYPKPDSGFNYPPQAYVKRGEEAQPFERFCELLASKQIEDAKDIIHTQADYWKAQAEVGIDQAMLLTGALMMFVPGVGPLMLALAGASIALGVDDAIHGRSYEERQGAANRIVFGLLNALPIAWMEAQAVREAQLLAARQAEETLPSALEPGLEPVTPDEVAPGLIADPKTALRPGSGTEPEGLRSLNPALRHQLAELEYAGPQEGLETRMLTPDSHYYLHRAGEVGEQGASFIRLHNTLYAAKFDAALRRFRIVSPLDETAGPWVRWTDAHGWDVDLRMGLRGGEEAAVVRTAATEAEPTAVASGVSVHRPPRQGQVAIEVPVTGVEIVRMGSRINQFTDQFYIEGRQVIFDTEVGAWESADSQRRYHWLSKNGQWLEGDLSEYNAVRHKTPEAAEYETYRLPKLPGYPRNPQPIEPIIHQVWVGAKGPHPGLQAFMRRNMEKYPQLQFVFHVDIEDVLAETAMREGFAGVSNLRISRLIEQPFYEKFLLGDSAEAFQYFRFGKQQNLAAASDILRYRIVYERGGIYMDCDDKILFWPADSHIAAEAHDVLVGANLDAKTLLYYGPGNSHFASHVANPVMGEMGREIAKRFAQADKEALSASRLRFLQKGSSSQAYEPYMSSISEMTGPQLFKDVLERVRPDYSPLFIKNFGIRQAVMPPSYYQKYEKVRLFYQAFSGRFKIVAGSENSWRATV
jgi:mannosyltransferase OCH1-like enzyme